MRGEGVWLEDDRGPPLPRRDRRPLVLQRRLRPREIADAVAEQLTRLAAYSSFGAYTTEPTLELADRLAAIAPIDDAVVFLALGRLGRRRHRGEARAPLLGRRRQAGARRLIVSREHGYHGMHAWGTALGGHPAEPAGYGGEPFINEVVHVPARSTSEALGAPVRPSAATEIAAFIGEPVIGAGGVIPPSRRLLGARSARCAASTTCCSSPTR